MNIRTLLLLPSLSLTSVAVAADLPGPVLPAGVGVNIHFTNGHERDLDLIAAAGFKFVRMDFSWSATERKPDEYHWADYDELTANLERRGIRPYFILDYSNALHEETITSSDPISGESRRDVASPSKPSSIAAFAKWGAAAAAHFKGKRVVWEIWNEPNIGFWKPKPDVANYTALVLETCRAMRAADPEATILAPASSEFPWAFIEHLFRNGVLEHLDGVSVHPYRSYENSPETAHEDYIRLRALIERHAPPSKRNLPIISGEWGYATQTKGGVTAETQAAFIARQQLSNLASGVPLSIWYDWKNDGLDRSYGEHNFGTVTADLQPKPAYHAVQTLTRELAGYCIVRELDAPAACRVLLLRNDRGDQKLAAWSTGNPAAFTFSSSGLTSGSVSAVDGQGKPLDLTVSADSLKLELGPAPQYVTFKRPVAELTAAGAWQVGPGVATLVNAGKPDGIRVPVTVTNPFDKPLLASLSFSGLPGVADLGAELEILPGKSATHVFLATLYQRTDARLTGKVAAGMRLKDRAAPLGRFHATLDFLIANPLGMVGAPSASGTRMTIDNPSGEPFSGRLVAGDASIAVLLTAGQRQAALVLTTNPGKAVELKDATGRTVGSLEPAGFHPLEGGGFRAALDGEAKVAASATVDATGAPGPDAPYPNAWRLDYQFASGWRFVRCVPWDSGGKDTSQLAPGNPSALGMWVHGDGSDNLLRCRLIDSAGQTFQPTGPNLDWRGWRWVTFDLTHLSRAGHWGGSNDGIPRGNLRLDCPLLVDGRNRETKGSIHFAGICWIQSGTSNEP